MRRDLATFLGGYVSLDSMPKMRGLVSSFEGRLVALAPGKSHGFSRLFLARRRGSDHGEAVTGAQTQRGFPVRVPVLGLVQREPTEDYLVVCTVALAQGA